jgi:hypothetical protein
MSDIIIAKALRLEPQNAAIAAAPGSKNIQLILGTTQQVDDMGVASPIGGATLPGAAVPTIADTSTITIPTFNGETAGGVEMWGTIQTPTVSGGSGQNMLITLCPNGVLVNTLSTTAGVTYTNKGLVLKEIVTATARLFSFRFRMYSSITLRGPRYFDGSSVDSNNVATNIFGWYQDAATAITSWSLKATYADGSNYTGNGIIQIIPGYPAGNFSSLNWRAIGNP